MPFTIRLGLPEMTEIWKDLEARAAAGTLSKDEQRRHRMIGKGMRLLGNNPRHPGLECHEIDTLTKKYGFKVFEAYLENQTPGAARMFWTYGPGKTDISVLGVEPHPEDGAYGRVKLSSIPSAPKPTSSGERPGKRGKR